MSDVTYLCNAAQATRELKDAATIKPDYLLDILAAVGSSINLEMDEEYEPVHATRIVYPNPVTVSPDYAKLTLKDDSTGRKMRLLELESVTSGTTTLTPEDDVVLFDEGGRGSQSLYMVTRRRNWAQFCLGNIWTGSGWNFLCAPRARYAVQVTGWWGYRRNYLTEGWHSMDVLAADMDDEVEQVTVTGGVKLRSFDGTKPRFAPGSLIRIEDEVMRVIEADASKTLTVVLRGQNGTANIDHEQDAEVLVWSVQPEIVRAAVRWVTLLQGRQGVFDTSVITDVGVLNYPKDMPSDVKALLRRFKNG